jgi:soluble lytic murein transglycosylase-like protein
MRLTGFCLLLVFPAFAGEYAVLSNGARLHVDRHEANGDHVRLYNGAGYTELAEGLVSRFEPDGQTPAVPASTPAAPVPAAAPATAVPLDLADAAADKYGLPRALVRSVMAAESGFQPFAVSPKGAIGLMQLMPGTAQTLNADPRDPAQNTDAGARYLRDLLQKYDGRLWHALAAYNAGPAAVDKYHGVPPYRETINYVKRIDTRYKKSQAAPPATNP